MKLKDKVAIITGGAYGLGNAYAMAYADEGAKIVIADIAFEAAKAAEEALTARHKEALALKVDVSKVEDTLEMAKKTAERFGGIDILVNNAAVLGRVRISRGVPFNELSLAEWDKVMAVNVTGSFLCCRAVFPYMKARGKGKIINVTSNQFFTGGGRTKYVHYVVSKGAVIGLTRALARELGEYNINVNVIAPGSTQTDVPTGNPEVDEFVRKMRQSAVDYQCLKRLEYPADLVGTAVFLASSDSDFITGQTLVVDGGAVFS
jgi:3-oxoacyl-[acyl-carrier protein] reductase